MTANTTDSSKGRMTCSTVAREEILESYLRGSLNDEERDAFEEHYFECAACFDALQTLQAIQGELRRASAELEAKTTRPFWRWAAAAGLAAAVVLAVGVALWMRLLSPSNRGETTRVAPSSAQVLEQPAPREPDPAVAPGLSLEQLARVEPPLYQPLRLRGAPDDATALFQRGMERYRETDYGGAVANLRAAAELDPDAAHVRFFLGISHLMLRQDDAAIDSLRATIALGDSAYLEEAHSYLAKAFLRRKDVRGAEAHLNEVIRLGGSGSSDARRLLSQLERLEDRSR